MGVRAGAPLRPRVETTMNDPARLTEIRIALLDEGLGPKALRRLAVELLGLAEEACGMVGVLTSCLQDQRLILEAAIGTVCNDRADEQTDPKSPQIEGSEGIKP